jgi:Helix-turn-helix domain
MSTPHIAWAFAQRDLTAAQRVVLIALAERANGERTCFPSEATLARDCELSRRSVIAAVQYLHTARRLIEIVTNQGERAEILRKAGAKITARVNVYRILRPADGAKSAPPTSGKSANTARSNGADNSHSPASGELHLPLYRPPGAQIANDGAKSAPPSPSEGANRASRVCKKRTIEGAPFAHEPLNESLQEEKRRASAPEAEAKSDLGTDPAGEAAPLGGKIDTSEFQRFLAERRAASAAAVQTVVAKTARALCSTGLRPQVRYAEHSVDEQIAASLPPRPEPEIPHGLEATVRAARRALAERAAQRMGAAA